jgi:hypothetical protein
VRGLGNESAHSHRFASGRTLFARGIELVDRGALGRASDQRPSPPLLQSEVRAANWVGDLALGHAAKADHRTGVCSM